jgi:hypothetical protein
MSRIFYEIVYDADNCVRNHTAKAVGKLKKLALHKESGIDGILVTVGLCIIALLLCVVMKTSMTDFIQTIVTAMTTKATTILSGT